MPTYIYIAKNKNGKTIKGKIEAPSREEVVLTLREKNYYLLKVEEEKKSWNLDIGLNLSNKITTKDLALFCRQFATTLRAGITVAEGLNLLSKQTGNKKFSQIIGDIYQDILKGNPLSSAMAKVPKVFPTLLVNMIETGEVSGNLESVMEDLAEHYEKEHKLNRKIKSALTYPIVVAIIAVLVVVALLTFVMPIFVGMFESFGAELPLSTRVIMSISNSLRVYWYLYLFVLILSIYVIKKYVDTPSGRYNYHKIILKIPIFGQLNTMVVMERFASTISVLLRSGVDILHAVEVIQKVVGNEYVKENLEEIRDGVRKGFGLGASMEATKVFPPLVYQMVEVGENSGTLDFVLEKIADYYQTEVEATISRLTTMIEPIIITALGVVVGFIVIAMIMPIFDLYNLL